MYILDAIGLSGIAYGKQKLGRTFDFSEQDGIAFTKLFNSLKVQFF